MADSKQYCEETRAKLAAFRTARPSWYLGRLLVVPPLLACLKLARAFLAPLRIPAKPPTNQPLREYLKWPYSMTSLLM